jgi:hypothetical protein
MSELDELIEPGSFKTSTSQMRSDASAELAALRAELDNTRILLSDAMAQHEIERMKQAQRDGSSELASLRARVVELEAEVGAARELLVNYRLIDLQGYWNTKRDTWLVAHPARKEEAA